MAERIQLSRKKGYRKPEGAVVVSRPTRWGNPFVVGDRGVPDRVAAVAKFGTLLLMRRSGFGLKALPSYPSDGEIRRELAGKSLACWCPLPAPGEPDHCHATVLLELAATPGEDHRP